MSLGVCVYVCVCDTIIDLSSMSASASAILQFPFQMETHLNGSFILMPSSHLCHEFVWIFINFYRVLWICDVVLLVFSLLIKLLLDQTHKFYANATISTGKFSIFEWNWIMCQKDNVVDLSTIWTFNVRVTAFTPRKLLDIYHDGWQLQNSKSSKFIYLYLFFYIYMYI